MSNEPDSVYIARCKLAVARQQYYLDHSKKNQKIYDRAVNRYNRECRKHGVN